MDGRNISVLNIFLMVILIVFWGSSFVVVRIALNEGLTPVSIATFRFLIAGGFFTMILILKKIRRRNYQLLVDLRDVPILLILALTGVTFFFTAQYSGIKMASASVAAIFVCLLAPLIITIFSARIFQEHLVKKQILGISIAAIGAFAVIMGGTPAFSRSKEFFLGSLILLSTPVLWAIYSLLGKKMMEKYTPFLMTSYITILGGLCLLPLSVMENSFNEVFSMTGISWLAILFLSVTCSLLGYYIWLYVLKQVGPSITSSFLFAEPLVTVLFSVIFVGEELNSPIIIGGLLIFLGVYLVTTR